MMIMSDVTCRRGYRGNALVQCRRGECFSDSECPDHKACFDYRCKDPCKGPDTSCGLNANCRVGEQSNIPVYNCHYCVRLSITPQCARVPRATRGTPSPPAPPADQETGTIITRLESEDCVVICISQFIYNYTIIKIPHHSLLTQKKSGAFEKVYNDSL